MDDLPGSICRLNTRLDQLEESLCTLEQRISALEKAEKAAGAQVAAEAPADSAAIAPGVRPEASGWQAGGMFPVLGRALLGIAGAYLLRAFAGAQYLPGAALEYFAIAYALGWLAAAARARTAFAASVYACTSTLILAPLLWELTMRFRGFPAAGDALTLAAFVGIAFALSRGPQRGAVLHIVNLSAAALCLALAIATHVNIPFLAVLLLIAGLCEWQSVRVGTACARALIALAADFGVWVLIYLYRAPETVRTDYPALSAASLIAPGFLLFAIYAAGVAFRNVMRRQRITIFDGVQVTIAFLLAASGLLYFGPAANGILGVLCLALATALYVAEFSTARGNEGRDGERRNQVIFGLWSAALLVTGMWLSVPESARAACLALAATAAMAAGAWLQRTAIAWHGTMFLLASAWISGLLAYAFHALAGTPAGAPSLQLCIAGLSAAVCYVLAQTRADKLRDGQVFPFVFAAIAALAAAALLVQGFAVAAATALEIGPHHLALIRSIILCAAALALAFSGARWRRPELTQIGYAVVVLEAIKLVIEDLRHGHLGYVAASVCLFAFTLIAIPRMARGGRRQKPAQAISIATGDAVARESSTPELR